MASLIPTGIRCSIGGYIGDAAPVTNKMASVCDYFITNPNAVNAGAFNFKEKNVLYVEGCAIDAFFDRKLSLTLPKKNSLGVLMEKIADKYALEYTLKTIEAFKAAAGIDIRAMELMPPIKKSVKYDHGQFCGEIEDVGALFFAAKKLVEKGCDAIAITTHIDVPQKSIRLYQQGKLPNPYGLLEALISHSVTEHFCIPAAHAPLLTKKEAEFFLFRSFASDPRAACECISPSYLGSVLSGLSDAPRLVPYAEGEINLSDVSALVIPDNCCRSIPVAKALKYGIPVIEVRENTNIFQAAVNPFCEKQKIFRVSDYDQSVKLLERIKTVNRT